MKTSILFLMVFFSTLFSCNSQNIKNKSKKDGKNAPHEKVTVNRKYDDNGNLIEFDSTYTSYYSNVNGDTVNIDTLLNGFPEFFTEEFSNFNSKNLFNSFFESDSVLNHQFFRDDYFEQQFVDQDKNLLKMMQEMDSIKNSFFEHQGKMKK